MKVNQNIEVRPGIVLKDESGNIKCTPIYSRIVSLYAEQNELQYAVPGGLIGVGTTMDPTLTRADRLVGQVLGAVGSLPDVFVELEVSFPFYYSCCNLSSCFFLLVLCCLIQNYTKKCSNSLLFLFVCKFLWDLFIMALLLLEIDFLLWSFF